MLAKYIHANFFVDHKANKTYVHLMRDFISALTLEAKHEWERLTSTSDVRILTYHVDNGLIWCIIFQDCKDSDQRIVLCGVISHHQNSITRHKFRDIVEYVRTLLEHGMYLWPDIIRYIVWIFAMKAVKYIHYLYMLDKDSIYTEEYFTRTKWYCLMSRKHHVFCSLLFIYWIESCRGLCNACLNGSHDLK